jgi:hypothetical protein
VLRLQA